MSNDNLHFSYATDTGTLSKEFIEAMSQSDIVVLESNHDKDLLKKSRRPIWLKKRIRETHLSNDETQNLLKQIINEKTKCVYFAHISGQCNSLHHVFDIIKDLIKDIEYENWKWSICPRYEKSSVLDLSQDKVTLEGGLQDDTISKRISETYSEHKGLRGYFE